MQRAINDSNEHLKTKLNMERALKTDAGDEPAAAALQPEQVKIWSELFATHFDEIKKAGDVASPRSGDAQKAKAIEDLKQIHKKLDDLKYTIFRQHDSNSDGKLDVNDFKNLLREWYAAEKAVLPQLIAAMRDRAMVRSKLDTSTRVEPGKEMTDGQRAEFMLKAKELIGPFVSMQTKAANDLDAVLAALDQEAPRIFAEVDTNRDGFISLPEFQACKFSKLP